MPACPSHISSNPKKTRSSTYFFSPFPLIFILPFSLSPPRSPSFPPHPLLFFTFCCPLSLTPSPPLPHLPSDEGASKRGRFTRAVISARPSFPFPSLSLSYAPAHYLYLARSLARPQRYLKSPLVIPSKRAGRGSTTELSHAQDCSMWQWYAKCVKTLEFAHRDTLSAQQQQQFTKSYNCIGHTRRNTHTRRHTYSFSAQSHAKRQKTN